MPKKELKSENSAGTALQEMESLTPGGDLQAYINSVHSIGILTSEEEKKLAEDLYYRNDLDAARKLVLAHLRFVGVQGRSWIQLSLILAPKWRLFEWSNGANIGKTWMQKAIKK